MGDRTGATGLRAWWRNARAADRRYRAFYGRGPRLVRLRRHSEWIHRAKVFRRDPRWPVLADKIEAKAFIAARVGMRHVVPTLYAGDALPPRAERTWPRPFFVKAAHGSSWLAHVPATGPPHWGRVEHKVERWLDETYGGRAGEWHYARMPRRILVEPHLGDPGRMPDDYKLWVFHGRVHFVHWLTDRGTPEFGGRFVDRDWNEVFRSLRFATHARMPERPATWDTMVWVAEQLGRDFPFVRVDLYEVAGEVYVGELTFTPTAGLHPFDPAETDLVLGRLWRRPRRPRYPAAPRPEPAYPRERIEAER